MKTCILNYLKSLDWRVLLAVPVLSVILGVVCNLCVPEEKRVKWSDVRNEANPAEIASLDVKPGEWTSDFDVATNKAAAAHVPVVVVVSLSGCGYCSTLHRALNGVAVKAWQKERGWYFAFVDRKDNEGAYQFLRNTPSVNATAPYVGVYWTRADGTKVMRNFPGRSGYMGVEKQRTLALEWMLAVETSVPGAPGLESGVAATTFVDEAKIRVATAVEQRMGAAGQVRKSPDVDFVSEGRSVTLIAEPQKGSAFAGWLYPDGRFICERSRLVVGSDFPEGTYTAVFLRPEKCKPPVLRLPEGEVQWKEGEHEKLTLQASSDDYPVAFTCKGLPLGMRVTSRTDGVVSGRPWQNGVWRVEVTAEGASRRLPMATGSFTVRVAPKERKDANDPDESGEEDREEQENDD